MTTLKEELKDIVGKKRRFLLFRIAEVEAAIARELCQIPQGTYNTWTCETGSKFCGLYQRLDELSADYKQEAIQLLRRDNQLAAVMLEERIIGKMKDEIQSGEYNLIRTNLARDVYTRLISDLDAVPVINASMSWPQRLQQIFINGQNQPALPDGEMQTIQAPAITVTETIPEKVE